MGPNPAHMGPNPDKKLRNTQGKNMEIILFGSKKSVWRPGPGLGPSPGWGPVRVGAHMGRVGPIWALMGPILLKNIINFDEKL